MKFYFKAIALLIVILLSVSGCGKKTEQPDVSSETNVSSETDVSSGTDALPDTVDSTSVEPSQSPDTDGKKTLTISVCWDYFAADTAEKFKKLHPEVEINITDYSSDAMKYVTQIPVSLMAGNADDILTGFGIDFQDPATVKSLTDYYPLMQADPDFNEDDYFTNVFKALEYKGGLYTFPASFTYNLAAINNQVSDELTDKFSQYHGISTFDLIDLYKSMPDESNLYMYNDFKVHYVFDYVKSSFINMENRTCDFNNPRFLSFLNDAKNALEPENTSGNILDDATQSKKYLYQMNYPQESYHYFLEFNERLPFDTPTPLTNENEQIIITPIRNYCINGGSENKELAWEFIKFIANGYDSDDNGGYAYLPSLPVNKKLFTNKLETEIPEYIDYVADENGWHIKGDAETEVKKVIDLMSEFSNMPMYFYHEFGLSEIASEPLTQFINGTMTAEQVASELQNKVTLKLME